MVSLGSLLVLPSHVLRFFGFLLFFSVFSWFGFSGFPVFPVFWFLFFRFLLGFRFTLSKWDLRTARSGSLSINQTSGMSLRLRGSPYLSASLRERSVRTEDRAATNVEQAMKKVPTANKARGYVSDCRPLFLKWRLLVSLIWFSLVSNLFSAWFHVRTRSLSALVMSSIFLQLRGSRHVGERGVLGHFRKSHF